MKGKSIVLNMDELKWNPKGVGLQRAWDSVQPGLNVRVYPTGKKVFYIRYNEQGKQRLRKLGDYPALSLENARFDAAEIREKAEKGIIPSATQRITMGQLWNEITSNTFYPFHSNAFSTQKNYLTYWNSYITFKDIPVTDIRAKHWRYHGPLKSLTPAYVYYGLVQAVLKRREQIKMKTSALHR